MKQLKQLIIFCCLLFSAKAMASGYQVKGVVVDSLGEAEMYATVRVFNVADTMKPISMGVTDETGAF